MNYFIGQAYEALGMDKEAKDFYSLATEAETSSRSGIMSYYQGLCFQKIKDKKKANEIFSGLIESGDAIINKSE